MESDSRESNDGESTVIEMHADKYERDATVASDGRLWLGDEWAGEDVEVALRKTGE